MTSRELFFQAGKSHDWGLVVDTSSLNGMVAAVSKNGELLSVIKWNKGQRHSDILLEKFLSLEKKYGKVNLKQIFFFQGPGSFTGLRIGAAFIKSLSYSLGSIPILCLSSFLPTAHAVLKASPQIEDFHILIPSIGDKVFRAKYQKNQSSWVEQIDFNGASSEPFNLENYFTAFSQISDHASNVEFTANADENFLSAVQSTTKVDAYTVNATHLDLYPLYLRQSEAEEKLRYDKAKL